MVHFMEGSTYDHIICDQLTRKRIVKIQNVRNTWLDSDHCLRIATVQLKGKEFRYPEREQTLTKVMRSDPAAEMIEEDVAKKMQHLIEDDADLDAEVNVKELWKDLKGIIFDAVKGRKFSSWPQSSKISKGTMNLIKERTRLRLQMQRKKVVPEKLKLELREIRKKVRLGIKKDRIQFFEDIAKEAEIASRVGDSKGVFSALRKATGTKGEAVDVKMPMLVSLCNIFKT